MVGEVLAKLLWQRASQRKNVLLAQLCKQPQFHDARVLFVKSIEVHIGLGHDVRVGGSQRRQWQSNVIEGGVEAESARKFSDLYIIATVHVQSEGRLSHEERGALGRIADVVDAKGDVFKRYGGIAQAAVFPVDAPYLINLLCEVDVGIAGYGLPKPQVGGRGIAR